MHAPDAGKFVGVAQDHAGCLTVGQHNLHHEKPLGLHHTRWGSADPVLRPVALGPPQLGAGACRYAPGQLACCRSLRARYIAPHARESTPGQNLWLTQPMAAIRSMVNVPALSLLFPSPRAALAVAPVADGIIAPPCPRKHSLAHLAPFRSCDSRKQGRTGQGGTQRCCGHCCCHEGTRRGGADTRRWNADGPAEAGLALVTWDHPRCCRGEPTAALV
jgi:hypothetical protein